MNVFECILNCALCICGAEVDIHVHVISFVLIIGIVTKLGILSEPDFLHISSTLAHQEPRALRNEEIEALIEMSLRGSAPKRSTLMLCYCCSITCTHTEKERIHSNSIQAFFE